MINFLSSLRTETSESVLHVVDHVWAKPRDFIRWPNESRTFMPSVVRVKYHQYGPEQAAALIAAGIRADRRSNGPAIMSYLLAGGERPPRSKPGKAWSIHHIYDGSFPFPGKSISTHAVKDGRYFTEAAGLVALHPIADSLADECAHFAWLLRYEAFLRFKFDPDMVFSNQAS